MALAKSAFVALPETLDGEVWLTEKPDSVDASDMLILSFPSLCAVSAIEASLLLNSS